MSRKNLKSKPCYSFQKTVPYLFAQLRLNIANNMCNIVFDHLNCCRSIIFNKALNHLKVSRSGRNDSSKLSDHQTFRAIQRLFFMCGMLEVKVVCIKLELQAKNSRLSFADNASHIYCYDFTSLICEKLRCNKSARQNIISLSLIVGNVVLQLWLLDFQSYSCDNFIYQRSQKDGNVPHH